MLPPGGTIGILGGGQLGRMTAMAAARLGYRTHVFATEQDAPAVQVAAAATIAPFGDAAAVARFADAVDVATFEFENIPGAAVRRVAAKRPVSPRPEILEITQDRLREKNFLCEIGVATTDYHEIAEPDALAEAKSQDFCHLRARIMAIPLGRSASVTSICFTGLTRGCFSSPTR